jgi:hypothetical protein
MWKYALESVPRCSTPFSYPNCLPGFKGLVLGFSEIGSEATNAEFICRFLLVHIPLANHLRIGH